MFVFAEHRDGKQAVINNNDGLISHNCSLVALLYVTPLLTYPQLPYLIKNYACAHNRNCRYCFCSVEYTYIIMW